MREEIVAYLRGALGDATYSKMHRTWRFSQSDRRWLLKLKGLLERIGYRSWLYQEGKKRQLYVLETSAKFLSTKIKAADLKTQTEKIAFVRGFFDAEGGVPRKSTMRFYVQFSQKNFEELENVRKILEEIGIRCGRMHNPSVEIDPDYWRFFVRAQSYRSFIAVIGSWHARKEKLLLRRMKI
jgi:predicted translin family RNA/ssDNA-binding protein